DCVRNRRGSDLTEPVVNRPGEDGLLGVEEPKRSAGFSLEHLLDLRCDDGRRTFEGPRCVLAQSTGETRSVFVSDSAASSADVEGHRHPSSLTGKTVLFV